MRSSRSSRFTSDDLPALGRPTIALAVAHFLRLGSRFPVPGSRLKFQLLDDRFHQIAGAIAVLGADLDDRVEAKSIQLERAGTGAAIIGLVDRENHRHAGITRGLGDFLVAGNQALAAVNDHDDQVGGSERAAALRDHQLMKRILAVAKQAASVGQVEVIALPRHGMGDDIAGRTGHGIDDRPASPAQTIEER
jgi:hypothetical protein